jgi:hypothetical protein
VAHQIVHSADWQPDSIPGYTIEFEPIETTIAGWPQHDREAIVSIYALGRDWRKHVPQDRTFRNAWCCDGAEARVDMPKARELWRDRMRKARAPLLAQLDVEYQRADEQGDLVGKRDVVARKQALRDVTADLAIETADHPEALKQCWPACLGDHPWGSLDSATGS